MITSLPQSLLDANPWLPLADRLEGRVPLPTMTLAGDTATVAAEVCTLPCVSVAGTRCTRWTPDSYFSRP